MKKRFKSMIGMLLAIALLLFACMPIIALAASDANAAIQDEDGSDILPSGQTGVPVSDQTDALSSEQTDVHSSGQTDALVSEQADIQFFVQAAETADESLSEPDASESPDATNPGEDGPADGSALPDSEAAEPPELSDEEDSALEVEPILAVGKPLVKVVYHYYDDSETQFVSSFADYALLSTHEYCAIAVANESDITVAANKFPALVPVSTDALRFRVLRNGAEDITGFAAYDAANGLVTLPYAYWGHDITVVWYCPASEIVELPVKVTLCVWEDGQFTTTAEEQRLLSDTNSITIPLNIADEVIVSQNGIDLDPSAYSTESGILTIAAPALGGDLSVSAYAISMQPAEPVVMAAESAQTQVDHTRSEDQIYYGYYTSYYTANGNTAFCLDPNLSGINTGTYPVSRFIQPGTGDDLLIKCAYYLYGGPGYDGIKYSLFDEPDTMLSYGLCHVVASYAYLNDAEAFHRLSTATINKLLQIIDIVSAQPMPSAGFTVFIYNEGSTTNQPFLGWEYDPTGALEIIKTSANTDSSSGNSCYSLAGAVFDVFDSGNQKVGSITTNANGRGRLEGIPAGTGYYIIETKPPQGYALNTNKISFSIVSGNTTTVQVSNIPQNNPLDILLQKQDADTAALPPQSNVNLAGAEFTVKYYKGLYSNAGQLSGVSPARIWAFRTDADGIVYLNPSYLVSGDAFYYAANGDFTLPLGTVTIQETKAPEGYLLNTALFLRQITSQGSAETVQTYNALVVKETLIRGGVSIEKWDIERNAAPQGDATLAGCVLDIYNRSAGSVTVGGTVYAPGEVVCTLTTDATGAAGTAANLLPYGQYEIVEQTPPTGYLNSGVIRQPFQIRENDLVVNLKTGDTTIKNDVIRGGVHIEKWDYEINEHRAQGGATLAGAVLEIVNRSAHSVLVLGELYASGEVVYTFPTDGTGTAQTTADLLPYGSYECREISPPTGYLATGVLSRTFTIREHGVTVNLSTIDTAIKNRPIRGDLRGVKISDGDAKRLGNVPFRITSVTTGESHVIVTDVNGEFNTASSWNPHSQNTNRGETDRDGVWFGELWTLNDDLGALPYDTYIIEELCCEANKDYELLTFEVSVYRHNTVIDLGTLTDDYTVTPEIFTTARDQVTGTNSAFVSETVTIIDSVYYSGLKPGQEYTLKGVLMDKETDEPLLIDGAPVTAEKRFRAPADAGSVTMAYTFDATALRGKSVVVFESLSYEGVEIATHADLEDVYQTIAFIDPKIGTSAAGADGEKELDICSEVTLIDTVSFEGLIPGETYTLKGILIDKASGEPLLIGGTEVSAETIFKPDAPFGSVDVVFIFDSTGLIGKTVVVFESLAHDGREVAVHADIDDEGQTVTFKVPKISTFAKAEDGSKTVPIAESVVVIDIVTYENLVPGETYVLKGILMDRESGEPLMKDGVAVTAETEFVPDTPSGNVEVCFTFDSRAIGAEHSLYLNRWSLLAGRSPRTPI